MPLLRPYVRQERFGHRIDLDNREKGRQDDGSSLLLNSTPPTRANVATSWVHCPHLTEAPPFQNDPSLRRSWITSRATKWYVFTLSVL